MKKVILFSILILLFSLSFIPAQPPFQASSGDKNIEIEGPIMEFHKQNQEFIFYIHAHNSTDGTYLDNSTTGCSIHIYNDGDPHLVRANMSYNISTDGIPDFYYIAKAGNFTGLGYYSELFYCEVDPAIESRGGFLESRFEVTRSGFDFSTSDSLLYVILLLSSYAFFSIFFYFGIRLKYSNEANPKGEVIKVTRTKYLKIFSLWLASGLFLVSMSLLTGLVNNFSSLEEITTLITRFYLTCYVLMYVITAFALILAFIEVYRDLLFNKEILKFGKAVIHGKY